MNTNHEQNAPFSPGDKFIWSPDADQQVRTVERCERRVVPGATKWVVDDTEGGACFAADCTKLQVVATYEMTGPGEFTDEQGPHPAKLEVDEPAKYPRRFRLAGASSDRHDRIVDAHGQQARWADGCTSVGCNSEIELEQMTYKGSLVEIFDAAPSEPVRYPRRWKCLYAIKYGLYSEGDYIVQECQEKECSFVNARGVSGPTTFHRNGPCPDCVETFDHHEQPVDCPSVVAPLAELEAARVEIAELHERLDGVLQAANKRSAILGEIGKAAGELHWEDIPTAVQTLRDQLAESQRQAGEHEAEIRRAYEERIRVLECRLEAAKQTVGQRSKTLNEISEASGISSWCEMAGFVREIREQLFTANVSDNKATKIIDACCKILGHEQGDGITDEVVMPDELPKRLQSYIDGFRSRNQDLIDEAASTLARAERAEQDTATADRDAMRLKARYADIQCSLEPELGPRDACVLPAETGVVVVLDRLAKCRAELSAQVQSAWRRLDYVTASRIAKLIGEVDPVEHEMADSTSAKGAMK